MWTRARFGGYSFVAGTCSFPATRAFGRSSFPEKAMIMAKKKRRFQFRLRTLLLVVSVTAAALGAVQWLGPEILPFVLAGVGVWISARTKARHLLVWLVPALWSACAFGSWHHPGDEYGMFVVSALAAMWTLFILKPGHLSNVYLLLIAAGALPMAGFGFLLDRLPVSRRLWSVFYIVASVGWFVWMLWQFPTLKAAIAKNGSISAYAFCASNLGLYVTVLLFSLAGTIIWLWRCCSGRRRKEACEQSSDSRIKSAAG